MMLKDKLSCALEQLEKNHQAQNRVRDDKKFETNLDKTLIAANALDTILNLLSEAKKQKILEPSISSDISNGLLINITNLYGQLQDRYFNDSDVVEIELILSNFKNEIASQWKTAASSKAEQVTSSLRLLGRFMPNPEQANVLVNKLNNGMQGLPALPSNIKAFAEAIVRGQEMVNGAGFDDEIKTFLQKVTNNRATLADITPKVQGWIQKQNLESRIKVSFS
jgi:hypothetical protein